MTDGGCILKVKTTVFPDGLDRGMRERGLKNASKFCSEPLERWSCRQVRWREQELGQIRGKEWEFGFGWVNVAPSEIVFPIFTV